MTDPETRTPSVARILAFSRELNGEELSAATAWAAPYYGDVYRALSECPRVTWLIALARALGADLSVDRWQIALETTPELVAHMTDVGRQLGDAADITTVPSAAIEALLDWPRPAAVDYQNALELLRSALDLHMLAARGASLPLSESEEEREERILAAALEDCRAVLREDLDDMTFAGLWGTIGGRTFRRVSRAGAERHIRETQALLLKRKWQSSS